MACRALVRHEAPRLTLLVSDMCGSSLSTWAMALAPTSPPWRTPQLPQCLNWAQKGPIILAKSIVQCSTSTEDTFCNNLLEGTILTIKSATILALTLALAGLVTSAHAGQQIDQQSTDFTNSNNTGTANPTVGQSFTDTLGLIDFAAFSLYVTKAASYSVELFSGSGFGGTLLATSDTQALAVGTVLTPVEFDFSSQIALDPGSVYTLQLVQVGTAPTSFKLGEAISRDNPYAGGSWFNGADGSINLANDLVFAEGYTPAVAAVPEPANAALLMAGLGFMGLIARRRQASK
jgi:hypothetical protein